MNAEEKRNQLLKQKKAIAGKNNPARNRLNMLFDQGSFVETDAFIKHRCTDFQAPTKQPHAEGVVTGYGTVNGRLVYGYAQDISTYGGSLSEMHCKKIVKLINLALKTGAPVVSMLDSQGARIEEGVDVLDAFSQLLDTVANANGVIPQLALVCGPCSGSFSILPSLCDLVIMARGTSFMTLSGVSVLNATMSTNLSPDQLCGASVHAEKSGLTHLVADNDQDAIDKAKYLLGYLPDNYLSHPEPIDCSDDLNRTADNLVSIMDTQFDYRQVISEIADANSFFEMKAGYLPNAVTAFIRLNGKPVGVVSTQGVELDCAACDKISAFLELSNSFNIPVLSITDCPGFVVSTKQEQSGMASRAAQLTKAFSKCSVPLVNLITGRAFGGIFAVMGAKQSDLCFAWPTAEIAPINTAAAADILFIEKLGNNPMKDRQIIVEKCANLYASPYEAAKRGYVDDIIDPAQTRPILVSAFETLATKRGKKEE